MSHPLYNPRGASFSGQRPLMSGQYGLGSQSAMDVGTGRLGPSSMIPPLMSQQLGFPMNQRTTTLSQDIETAIDLHIRGAREEVRLLSQLMQQQKVMDPRLRKESRDEVLTQGTGFPSQRVPGRLDEQSSVDWSNYRAPTKLFSSEVLAQPSPPTQLFQPSGFGTSTAGGSRGSLESQHSVGPTRYTSESASSILASFGLSNEDLEHLSHYPDEQLTPDNLPFILRDIRLRKAKQNLSDMDHARLSPASERVGSESRHSKVIDYGHSSKFGYSEENPEGFQLDQLPKESSAFIMESSVNSSTFPMVDPKRPQSSAVPGPKKPTVDQKKHPPDTKIVKTASGRAPDPKSMPASSRPVALPPGHSAGTRSNLLNFGDGGSGPKPGYVATKSPWSLSFPSSNSAKRLPTPTMMNDYSAASPRIFPHTCSLCNIECVQIKDWIEHQNTSVHIESCRRLRKQYPDWDVENFPVSRNTSLDRRSPARRSPARRSPARRSPARRSPARRSSARRSPARRSPARRSPARRTRSPSRSRSWSRSPSPWRYHSRSGSRGRRPRSRSRSPWRHRRSRSRSRSRSPRRGCRSSPARRSRTPQRSRSRSFDRDSPERRPRRTSSHHVSRSSSTEKLAKKLIESTGLSAKGNITLEAMMQSLAPALLAELAKRKGGSSSASAKSSNKKKSSSPPSASKKNEPSKHSSASKAVHSTTAKSSSSVDDKAISSTSKNVKVKKKAGSGTTCALRFVGVPYATTHQEFLKALEPFGKVNSAILMKKIEEASVFMEREEDARVLAQCKTLKIHGRSIEIFVERPKEVLKAPQKQVKKKEATMTKSSVKTKVLAKGTGISMVKKKEVVKKYVVEITGLPESGCTVEDLVNIASPFGTAAEVIVAIAQRKALIELPGQEALENMVKACKKVPVKIKEQQLSVTAVVKPIDLHSVESIYRLFMGIQKPAEDDGLADRILVVNNVPSSSTGVKEVQQLIRSFGSVKQALVLNGRIIFEMDSAPTAKAVFNRFQKFPCIIHNNSLKFSLITPQKSTEEVKKKTEGKSPKLATKPSDMAKRVSTSSKSVASVGKVKAVKSLANTNTTTKDKLAVTTTVATTVKLAASASTVPASVPASVLKSTAASSSCSAAEVSTPVVAQDVSVAAISHSSPLADCNTTDTQAANITPASSSVLCEAPCSSTEEGGMEKTLLDAAESRETLSPKEDTCSASAMEQELQVPKEQREGEVATHGVESSAPESGLEPQENQTSSVSEESKQDAAVKPGDCAVSDPVLGSTDLQAPITDSQEVKPVDLNVPSVPSVGSDLMGGKSSDPMPSSVEPQVVAESNPVAISDMLPPTDPQPGSASVNGTQPPSKPVPPNREEDKPLGFPPVTPEILRALEAAVQECRMRASMQAKSGVPSQLADRSVRQHADKRERSERSAERDRPPRASAPAQSDNELPPVTCRGGSSGSSSGSRKSKGGDSPASKKGRGHDEESGQKSHSSKSSKMSRSSPKAMDDKTSVVTHEEQHFPDESFPFDLDEFVTVDEVGDDVDLEPLKGKQLPQSPSASDMTPPAKRMRLHEPVKGQEQQQQQPAKGQAQKKSPAPSSKLMKKSPAGTKTKPARKAPPKPEGSRMDAVTGGATQELSMETMELEEGPEKSVPEVQEEAQGADVDTVKASDGQQESVSEFFLEKEGDKSETKPPATVDDHQEHRIESGQTADTQDGSSLFVPAKASVPAVDVSENTPIGQPEMGESNQEPEEPKEERLQADLEGEGGETALVTLDEVSEEEEDYPEEEEELLGLTAGGDDPDTLVTVDEVGGDEDPFLQAVRDLQALVTLDEIVEEEDGNEQVGSERFPFAIDDECGEAFNPEALVTLDETRGDEETVEEGAKENATEKVPFQLVNATAATEPETPTYIEPAEVSGSPGAEELRKMSFVTVDEIGEDEEPAVEEGKAQLSTRRGAAVSRRRTRPSSAVRKSVRGRKGAAVREEEAEVPEAPHTNSAQACDTEQPPVQHPGDPSAPEPGLELPRMKNEVPDGTGGSVLLGEMRELEQKPPECPAEKQGPVEGSLEPQAHAQVREESKTWRDEMIQEEPEVKKIRSESPFLKDFKLPPFSADQPIGLEFVVPKTGFFCRLCSLFYANEETAKKMHCSSLKHYQNVERYMMKQRMQQGRGHTQGSGSE